MATLKLDVQKDWLAEFRVLANLQEMTAAQFAKQILYENTENYLPELK